MRKLIALMLIMALLLGVASAENQDSILGKPFPDFIVTDTEGNTFTLYELLKDHEAVLVNIWATSCVPCQHEFMYLTEAYGKYQDRVAFIALSREKKDTLEKIAEYREANGIPFAMGRDEEQALTSYINHNAIPLTVLKALTSYINHNAIPLTVLIDRYGNAVFQLAGPFISSREIFRLLDAVLGENYTQSTVLDNTVLDKIPNESTTQAFPVSSSRAIIPENENIKQYQLQFTGEDKPVQLYVINEDTAHLRFELAATDNPGNMILVNLITREKWEYGLLLNAGQNAYVLDVPMSDRDNGRHFSDFYLLDFSMPEETPDPNGVEIFIARSEEDIDEIIQYFQAKGLEVTATEATFARDERTLESYILHVIDQDGYPVEEVTVNFCTDTACIPAESDENGLITFTGAPNVYHVTIVDVPDGYSWDEEYEMYTSREYGEWILRVRKD